MYFKLIASLLFVTAFTPGSRFTPAGRFPVNDGPLVIESKVPVYPPIALAAHAAGTVLVEVEADSSGKVVAATVISGPPMLRVVSRNAALGWRFGSAANLTDNQKVVLTFEFVRDLSYCEPSYTITPYHLRIGPGRPPETISYVENQSEKYCKLHGVRLLRDTLTITYGLVGFLPGYEKAEKKLFPNANAEAFGGCVLETEVCNGTEIQLSPKYAEVLYCDKCRRAQTKWTQKQRPAPANLD